METEKFENESPKPSFEELMKGYLQFNSGMSPCKKDVIERWGKLFQSIPEESEFRPALDFVLTRGLAGAEFSKSFLCLQNILPDIEALQKSGHWWDAIVSFMALSWRLWRQEDERITTMRNKQQTEEANKTRQKLLQYSDALLALEEKKIIYRADCAVHKKKEDGEFYKRNSRSVDKCLNSFFRENESEITEILKNFYPGDEIQQLFKNMFMTVHCVLKEKYNQSLCGYIFEKRAPRSEESRERSSQGALKAKHAKKLIKKKQKKTKQTP